VTAKPAGERGGAVTVTSVDDTEGAVGDVSADQASAVDALFRQVDEPREGIAPAPVAALVPVPALRTARVLAVEGRAATIAWRGAAQGVEATIAPEVDRELVIRASAQGDAVLVEWVPDEAPIVVGIVQTRVPDQIDLRARVIHLNADHEILLRAGTGAVRIREDGDVEIVGSRISASSRGLFRLVGRILRLN